MITLKFACGAQYETTEMPEFSHRDKGGRVRLLVYDSEGCNPPKFPVPKSPEVAPPCLHGCPNKRASGRKQIRAMRSDGGFRPPRLIVTCYAEVIEP